MHINSCSCLEMHENQESYGLVCRIEKDANGNVIKSELGIGKQSSQNLRDDDMFEMLKPEAELLENTVPARQLLTEELREVRFGGEVGPRNVELAYPSLAEFPEP